MSLTSNEFQNLQANLRRLLDTEELDETHVSRKTVQNWIRGAYRPQSARKLRLVAEAFGTSVPELLSKPADTTVPLHGEADSFTFQHWEAIARDVDERLLRIARQIPPERTRDLVEAHEALADNALRRHGSSLAEWVRALSDEKTRGELAATLPPVGFTVEVDPGFGRLEYRLPGGASLPLRDPELLWDCPCDSCDANEGSAASECRIHTGTGPLGEAMSAAFKNAPAEIRWGQDLVFRWTNRGNLWPPSVDSFHFLDTMRRHGLTGQPYRRIMDIGSGTGFLGIALAALTKEVEQVILADWLLTPALYGAVNWHVNRAVLGSAQLEVRVSSTIGKPAQEYVDLLVCNPPYLPILPGFEELRRHAVVAGTELLSFVIRHGPVLAKRVLVQYSDVASNEDLGLPIRGVELEPIGEPRRAPFRVVSAWRDVPGYFESLKPRLESTGEGRGGHVYWHRIQLYDVRLSRAGGV